MADLRDRAYMSFGPELQRLLASNGIAVQTVLERAHFTEAELVDDPAAHASAGNRDAAILIMASAAAIAAATPLITRIIALLTDKPIVTRSRELVPALDGHGSAILDAKGNPVMTWRDTEAVDRSKASSVPSTSVGGLGFNIEIGK